MRYKLGVRRMDSGALVIPCVVSFLPFGYGPLINKNISYRQSVHLKTKTTRTVLTKLWCYVSSRSFPLNTHCQNKPIFKKCIKAKQH